MAKDEGMTDDEIGAVQAIVMAVSAGRVRAQFREARLAKKRRDRDRNGTAAAD